MIVGAAMPTPFGPGSPGPGELVVGGRLQRPRQAEAAVPYRVVHGGQAGVEPGAEERGPRGARGVVLGAEPADRFAQVRLCVRLRVAQRPGPFVGRLCWPVKTGLAGVRRPG